MPGSSIGTAASVYNALFMGGRALFSLLFGAVYEAAGSRTVFWICFACAAAALLFALLSGRLEPETKEASL